MRGGRLRSVYLGPEYSDEEVRGAIEASKLRAKYVGDDVNEVADLIAKGNVVTWYQGRSELGPRALGNRSILADPRDKEMWKRLNAIKGMEFWRPLAPSLLEEDKDEYFVDPVAHEFMILMFRFRDSMSGRIPAVYHECSIWNGKCQVLLRDLQRDPTPSELWHPRRRRRLAPALLPQADR